MKHSYKLTWIWRYLLIVSCVGFLLIILMVIIGNGASVKDDGFYWLVLFFVGMAGLSYGALSSKITTSTEGIEYRLLGIRVKVTWDKVEKIDMNPYGVVNLFFREPLYKNQFINALLRPLAYERTIQLSPYIEDLASSNLLKDIAEHAPNSNILRFVTENKRSRKTYQKAGTIGLYYLGFLILMVPLAFAFRKGAQYLATSGFENTTLIFYIMSSSLIIGLMLNGMSLLGYNAEVAKFKDSKISRKARTLYLMPVVLLVISFVAGVSIWAILQSRSIVIEEESNFVFLAIFLGIISLRVSMTVEGLIFKNNVQ